jgi:hypothetical protein
LPFAIAIEGERRSLRWKYSFSYVPLVLFLSILVNMSAKLSTEAANIAWRARQQTYERLKVEARLAEAQGDKRLAADKYLEAFRAEPTGIDPERYSLIMKYSNLSVDLRRETNGAAIQMSDFEKLEEIAKDPNAIHFYRAFAAYHLAYLHLTAVDGMGRWKAYGMLVVANELCLNMNSYEDTFLVLHVDGTKRSMADATEELKRVMARRRAELEETPSKPTLTNFVRDFPDFDLRRLAVGGDKCDCCGISKEDAETIYECPTCKRSFDCGDACADKLWDQGHEKDCRGPNQFQVGDYVMTRGIRGKPELDHQVVKITSQQGNRWEVMFSKTQGFAVTPDKLVHVRSPLYN